MSEPPLKKKRTILDFFPNISPPKKAKGTKAPMASSSGAEPVAGKSDDTGSTASEHSDLEADATEQQLAYEENAQIPEKKPSQVKDGSNAWKGIPLATLDKLQDDAAMFGPLKPSDNHKVLFKTPYEYDPTTKRPPQPFKNLIDKWDNWHVRMPFSNANEYPVSDKTGRKVLRRRWEMIEECLICDIRSPYDLAEKILAYNSRYHGKWNFEILSKFFQIAVTREERLEFFNKTLPAMQRLALQSPSICSAPIPLLRAGHNYSVTLSQQQIGCLLANAFFCTFPRRTAKGKNSEYHSFPSINFNTLFCGAPTSVKFEKIKCIINYFTRFFKQMPLGTVTFTRQYIDKMPDWEKDSTQLRGLHVSSEGTIEDDGDGLLQVDFANMFMGGGVLGQGCVQEEIRFLICPEMIVSRLFTEVLGRQECLIMTGCERFSNYEGYASRFEWKENYVDKTPRDSWGRIMCQVVAIDALVIHDFKTQFQLHQVKRELSKAYCGFMNLTNTKHKLPAVCTGNWGCGAFGGDKQLKALIQLMAAAKAGRDLCYFTFDDEKIRDQIFKIHKYLTSDNLLTIGDLVRAIDQYAYLYMSGARWPHKHSKSELFEYILQSDIKGQLSQMRITDHKTRSHGHGSYGHSHHGNRSRSGRSDGSSTAEVGGRKWSGGGQTTGTHRKPRNPVNKNEHGPIISAPYVQPEYNEKDSDISGVTGGSTTSNVSTENTGQTPKAQTKRQGDIMKLIEQYRRNILLKSPRGKPSMTLYDYIPRVFDGSLEDTDEDSNQGDPGACGQVGGSKATPQSIDPQSLEFGSDFIEDFDNGAEGNVGKKLKREDSEDYKANTP